MSVLEEIDPACCRLLGDPEMATCPPKRSIPTVSEPFNSTAWRHPEAVFMNT
jgi:hypothetical protein